MPRAVIHERLQKLYATFSVPQLLSDHGIEDDQLVTPVIDPRKVFVLKNMKRKNFTPLWYYDNTEFDSRNADEWVKDVRDKVQALVYLPVGTSGQYDWLEAYVIRYDLDSNTYTVVLPEDRTKAYPGIRRIRLCFREEDPREFVKRIEYAVRRRDYCEKIMLWYMYMDKINKDNITKSLSNKIIRKLRRLIKKLNITDGTNIIEEIVNTDKRSQFSVLLRYKISKNPNKFKYIDMPDFDFGNCATKLGRLNTGMCNYTYYKNEYLRKRLFVIPEVLAVLWNLTKENMLIDGKRFFSITFTNTVTLEQFEKIQIKCTLKTLNTLKNDWIKDVTNRCRDVLKSIDHGWFNISLGDFYIYESPNNKLRKLMTLIQYVMEKQLRSIVVNSVKMYASLIHQPCISMMGIDHDFSWGNNLYQSPFPENSHPIFSLTIEMNENGPYYSTDPDKFEPVIVQILTNAILHSHGMPAIHAFLLKNITFFEEPTLTSIGLLDDEITEQNTIVENSVRSVIIPLKAYREAFAVHLPLFNTDVQTYTQTFFDGNPSLIQIREEISSQIRMKANLEKTLPRSIAIGLFLVHVRPLKRLLVDKRGELATLLMKTHANMICQKLEVCFAEYRDIYVRLEEDPVSVEQIFETRDWIDTLTIIIQNQYEISNRVIMDLEMLDTFLWTLDREQMQLKWDVKIWPYKIELKIKEYLSNLAAYIEQFEKVQFEDELLLQDRIEDISSAILKLTIENDLSKVFEIAVEVNKSWKFIEELQLFGETLNHRQKLFGHTVTPFENVQTVMSEFEPYKELWTSAAEFYKTQNAWLQNPLANIDRNSLEPQLNGLLKIIMKSVERFTEIPGALSVAKEIKTQIENYQPTTKLLKDILNPGMRQRHWDQLASKTGVKIVSSPSLTFKQCLELGVDKHEDELKRISDNASEEYVIELAMDKMMKEWNDVKLQFESYNDTGTYVMNLSEEGLRMLDDHILLTERLSLNSFKGIFEEQLVQWDADLRLAKEVIETWIEFQKQWMYLEPMFADPDVKNQLVVENKRFNSIERQWKRLTKLALNKPWVMLICPDKRFLDILNYGNTQLNKITKKLSDYEETKLSVIV